MKKAIFILFASWILVSFGCSKDSDNKCWECEKTFSPYEKVEICDNSNTAPTQHTDGLGNTYSVKNCKK